jgi:hypothetical protein
MRYRFMRVQIPSLSEGLGTPRVRAFVGLLPGMNADVGLEIEIDGKTFGAVRAFEGFFTSVNELMTTEFGVVLEAFLANLA